MKRIYFLLCLIAALSCGSDDGAATLARIEINTPNVQRLDIGESITLTVNGFDQDNSTISVSTTITWSSSNANATVDQNGTVTGVAVGTSTITATTEGIQASIEITVWDSSAPRTEIYVSDAGSPVGQAPYQILRYDEDGSNGTVFIDDRLNWPQDILFLEDQNVVLISNLNNNAIARYNIDTGDYIDNFATGISGPTRMKIGPDGLLYVLQWSGDGQVLRYQLDGTSAGAFTDTGVRQSIGLDWDDEGNLYVSSFNDGNGGFVRKFNAEGVDQGNFIASSLQGPTDIWFDSSGNLWANDWQAGQVKRFNGEGTFMGVVISGLSQTEGVAFMENGNMLIGNGGNGNGSIKMYTATGQFIEDLVSPGAPLRTPNAVTVRKVN